MSLVDAMSCCVSVISLFFPPFPLPPSETEIPSIFVDGEDLVCSPPSGSYLYELYSMSIP